MSILSRDYLLKLDRERERKKSNLLQFAVWFGMVKSVKLAY